MGENSQSSFDEANRIAVARIIEADAILIDIAPAIKAIPGFKEDLFTYAGPPIDWARMVKPQKLALTNLIMYEGFADTPERAERLVETGEVVLRPNHSLGNVSGMCGATSFSLPVLIVENKVHGNRAYDWQQTDLTAFGDVYGKVKELEFVKNVLAPVMKATIKEAGGINVKELLARGLQMGDELHGSFDACRSVLMNWILPHIVKTDFPKETLAQVGDYFMAREGRWYCGNLMMAACKAMIDPARDIESCTLVTAMARNGVEFGIQVSALGNQWFTGPAGTIKGFVFPGFKQSDSTLDIGDSAISETRGLGGTAIAASPGQARFIGEDFQDAVNHTRAMREVSVAEDPLLKIPYLGFEGVPVGIDIRKVLSLGIYPKINTAMAHKDGGHPMIGAGVAEVPSECFSKALRSLVEKYA